MSLVTSAILAGRQSTLDIIMYGLNFPQKRLEQTADSDSNNFMYRNVVLPQLDKLRVHILGTDSSLFFLLIGYCIALSTNIDWNDETLLTVKL